MIGGAGEFAKDDEKQLVITSQTKPQEKFICKGILERYMRIINGKREEGKNFKAGFVSKMHRRRKCGIFCMKN